MRAIKKAPRARRIMNIPRYQPGSGYGGVYRGIPRYRRRPWALLVALIAAILGYGYQQSEGNRPLPQSAISGVSPRIIDGDTFSLGGYSFRLWGIDAPERDTAEGLSATQALANMLREQHVSCAPLYWNHDRIVAKCQTSAHDISEKMVNQGWARDLPGKSGGAYAAQEASARQSHLGMWK